jgi:hypothetical protein
LRKLREDREMANKVIKFTFYLFLLLCLFLTAKSQNDLYDWNPPRNLEHLNSKADEFAASFNPYTGVLFFNSTKNENSLFYTTQFNLNKDILKSFSEPVLLTDEINQTSRNQSYISFSDKENAYFTSFRIFPRGSVMNIFQSRYIKNNWQEGEKIASLETDNFRFHPALSPSGNMMVFSEASSNNSEDADLWAAYRNDKNEWIITEKLDELNSNLSEITPFFAAEDTLYFASNGFSGKGGFDIYSTIKLNGRWQKPRPVTTLNTEFDESDFTRINSNIAIFSSNRPGGKGALDLWITEYQEPDTPFAEPELKLASAVEEIEITKCRKFILANKQVLEKCKMSPDFYSIVNENVIKIYLDSFYVKPAFLETTVYPKFTKDFSKVEIKFAADNFADSILLEKTSEKSITNLLDLKKFSKKLFGSKILNLSASIVNSEDLHSSEKLKQIDLFNSTKEIPEEININGSKFNIRILLLPDTIDEKILSGFSEYIRQIKSPFINSQKVIIESSPTFGLTENQIIRDWCKSSFSNIKDVLFQKNIYPNLSEYLTVDNFNYLILLIQN